MKSTMITTPCPFHCQCRIDFICNEESNDEETSEYVYNSISTEDEDMNENDNNNSINTIEYQLKQQFLHHIKEYGHCRKSLDENTKYMCSLRRVFDDTLAFDYFYCQMLITGEMFPDCNEIFHTWETFSHHIIHHHWNDIVHYFIPALLSFSSGEKKINNNNNNIIGISSDNIETFFEKNQICFIDDQYQLFYQFHTQLTEKKEFGPLLRRFNNQSYEPQEFAFILAEFKELLKTTKKISVSSSSLCVYDKSDETCN